MMVSPITRVLDLLSPRQCAGCHSRLGVSESLICHRCFLHFWYTHYAQHAMDNPMARMFWGVVDIQQAAAHFFYKPGSASAQIVHAMKYDGRREVAEYMGRQLGKELVESGFAEPIDALVPVPLTEDRQRERGYNQSDCLARGVAQVTGLPVYSKALRRTAFSDSQTRLNFHERRENVAHAFVMNDFSDLQGKHILLVDDVMTTGATLMACATALHTIPDVKVSVATLGLAQT